MPADLTPSISPGAAPVSVPAAAAADTGGDAPTVDFAALLAFGLQGKNIHDAKTGPALPAVAPDDDKRTISPDSASAAPTAPDPAAFIPVSVAPLLQITPVQTPPETGPQNIAAQASERAADVLAPARDIALRGAVSASVSAPATAGAPVRDIAPRGTVSASASAPAAAGAPVRDPVPVAAPAVDVTSASASASTSTSASALAPASAPASAPTAALQPSAQESPRVPRESTGITEKPAPAPQIEKHESAPAAAQLQPSLPPVAPAPALHAASAESVKVEPRVGSQEWSGALGQRVVWMAGREQQVAELHLNPPDLGPLQVVLSVSNDQASAQFFSHHAVVREAVEAALPQLRQMLADNGITLGQASVSADTSSRQADSGHEQRGHPGGATLPDDPASSRPRTLKFREGLVDTFA